MKIKGSGSINQLEPNKTRYRCNKWRLFFVTDQGRKSRRFDGTWQEANDALLRFRKELELQDSRFDKILNDISDIDQFSDDYYKCLKKCEELSFFEQFTLANHLLNSFQKAINGEY